MGLEISRTEVCVSPRVRDPVLDLYTYTPRSKTGTVYVFTLGPTRPVTGDQVGCRDSSGPGLPTRCFKSHAYVEFSDPGRNPISILLATT